MRKLQVNFLNATLLQLLERIICIKEGLWINIPYLFRFRTSLLSLNSLYYIPTHNSSVNKMIKILKKFLIL